MNENRCVSCGEIIPEGTQVCPVCMAKALRKQERQEKVEDVLNDWVFPLLMFAIIIFAVVYVIRYC